MATPEADDLAVFELEQMSLYFPSMKISWSLHRVSEKHTKSNLVSDSSLANETKRKSELMHVFLASTRHES